MLFMFTVLSCQRSLQNEMHRTLCLLMLALYGLFVLLLLHRHASYMYCVDHHSNQAKLKSFLGYPYKSTVVCTFSSVIQDFTYSVCAEVYFPKYIPPYCLLNQSLELPFHIVLGMIILLALISLSCYPWLTMEIVSMFS